jgi:hypothetical protein
MNVYWYIFSCYIVAVIMGEKFQIPEYTDNKFINLSEVSYKAVSSTTDGGGGIIHNPQT